MDTKLFVRGNALLLLCCAFYLAWWLIAFKPAGAIKGMRSGWLLIPAAVAGLAAVVELVQGTNSVDTRAAALPNSVIWVAGVVVYALLLAVTGLVLHRQVTTELVLIVGWATLVAAQANTLCAAGTFRPAQAVGLCVTAVIFAIVSLACYLAYYELDAVKGYVDGAVPLALVAVLTAVTLVMLH